MSTSWAKWFMLTHSSIKAFIRRRWTHVEPDRLILVLSMTMCQVSLIHRWQAAGSHVGWCLLGRRSNMPSEWVMPCLRSTSWFSWIPSLNHILRNIFIINLFSRPSYTVSSFLSFQRRLSLRCSPPNNLARNKTWTISSWRWLSFFPFFLSLVLVDCKARLVHIVKVKFAKASSFLTKVIRSKFVTLTIHFIRIVRVVSCLSCCHQQLLNRIWTHSANSLSPWMISKHL